MYNKADTHMHTTFSDGISRPEELVDYVATETDLGVIAITDHDTAEGGLVARDYCRNKGLDLEVIVGQEVTTDEGDVVGLFIDYTMPAFATAYEAINAIHEQGGLAIAVHPFSRIWTLSQMHGVGAQIASLPLDGVEVRNGFPANLICNPWTVWYNRRYGQNLSELGGSDSHVPFTIGQSHTLFPGRTAADLRRAIESRQTKAAGSHWKPSSLARLVPVLARHGFPSRMDEPDYSSNIPTVGRAVPQEVRIE